MVYKKVQFIAYCIHTGPKRLSGGKQEYLGLNPASNDIAERVKLVANAIETARTHNQTKQSDSTTLKLFMIPEFFFRGKTGAYSMDDVQKVVTSLQNLVKDKSKWEHWLFAFGTIVGQSSPSNPAQLIEAYNYVLVQKGGFGDAPDAGPKAAKAILKEHKSGIDFIETKNSVGGVVWERVKHLEPSRPSGTGSEVQKTSYDGSSVFKIDDITFGLEVCLDHSEKRLKKSKKFPQIDIQLVPSCGMSIQNNAIVAKNGGYIFNCDGLNGTHGFHSQVLKIGQNEINIAATVAIEPADVQIDQIYARGPGEVHIYPEQNLS